MLSRNNIYIWSKHLSLPPSLPSSAASQFLCLNKDIQIDNKCAIFSNFSKNAINLVRKLFDSDGKLHCWEFLKEKYLLSHNMKFCQMFPVNTRLTKGMERSYFNA